jgi:hypothetical protein
LAAADNYRADDPSRSRHGNVTTPQRLISLDPRFLTKLRTLRRPLRELRCEG